MAIEKSFADDAKTSNDSKHSAQNGSKEQVAKPNGSKPGADEIRKRAFEAFQARHGEPGSALEDWQKAESSLIAEATNASEPKADAPKPEGAKADAPKANWTKPKLPRPIALRPMRQSRRLQG